MIAFFVALAIEAAPANALPAALLEACDARAATMENYAPAIAASADALLDMGVFAREDFSDVKISFCPLVAAGGPVAAASCASDIILLDDKYAQAGQSFVLNATLAHEMKHVLQHRAGRARYGAAYCDSARYAAEKPQLEAEADAFGDATGMLFSQGRPIEVENRCAAPLAIYLEPADAVEAPAAAPAFTTIPPRQRATLSMRALSSEALFYARTRPLTGPAYVFERASSPHRRFIGGRAYRLREARLANAAPASGPFQLRLSCPRS